MPPTSLGIGIGLPRARVGGLPLIQSLAIAGDSITAQNGTTTGFNARGYAACGRVLLNAGFEFVNKVTTNHSDGLNYTFGYGSYSAADFLNGNRLGDGVYPMQDVAAADPENIFVCLGSNPSETTVADILTIWDTWLAAGRRVFAAEILPRGSAAQGYDAAKLAACYSINAILKAESAARKIPFLEWASSFAESPGGYARAEYMYDAVHPNILGASVLGERFAAFFAPYVRIPHTPPPEGSSKWVTNNPYMAGNSSGLATGFSSSGASITGSKVTDPDGTVWQRVHAASAINTSHIRQSNGAAGFWSVGDVVRPVARVRAVLDGWALQNVRLAAVKIGAPTNTNISHDMNSITLDGVRQPFDGILYGPPYTIPADATAMSSYFYVSGTGSVDVRQLGLVKVS